MFGGYFGYGTNSNAGDFYGSSFGSSEREICQTCKKEANLFGAQIESSFIKEYKPFEYNPPTTTTIIRCSSCIEKHGEVDMEKYNARTGSGPVVSEKKIGRNDPCSCNSGKKYKKCCQDKILK